MRRPAAAWLGRGAGGPAADGSGALIRHPAMDDWVRRVCAVHADGRCLIAEGHESDRRLRAALLALRRDGNVPASLIERTASLDEIAARWRAADREESGEAPAARRVRMLFEEAAAARASDVVFENDGGLCRVYGIVNDRKLQLAEPLPGDEGREVMGFLFHCKDEGSAQTSYQRSAFQGFSVRAGGQVPLPATVSALRCQRGPHEPDGDHLFARLFYRTLTGSAFLFVVMEFLAAGIDVNDRAFEALKRSASPYVRHRIASIQGFMARGAGLGRSMVLAGHGFPDPSLVPVVAALDGAPGWERKLARFVERWVGRSEELLRARAAALNGALLILVAGVMGSGIDAMFSILELAAGR